MTKYAILRRNGIGDFICGCVPLVLYLIKSGKAAEEDICFFCSDINKELVKYFFPKANIAVLPKGNKYVSAIKTALMNRKNNCHIGILPIPDYPKIGAIFMWLLGCKQIYGRTYGSKIARILINHKYAISDTNQRDNEHVALTSIKIFDSNVNSLNNEFYPCFNKKIIKDFGRDLRNTVVLCEVSNNRVTSQLSVDNIAMILNNLYKTHNFNVLISTKPKDFPKAIDLKGMLIMDAQICISNNIDEFVSLVNMANIVLTGDGGLGHVAGALNKKIVALYAITSIKQWGILSESCYTLFDKENVNNISTETILNLLRKCFNNETN